MKRSVIIVCAGVTGIQALDFFGDSNVLCFADNSLDKQRQGVRGKRVIAISNIKNELEKNESPCDIIIALPYGIYYDASALNSVAHQLRSNGISNYFLWDDIKGHWILGDEFLKRCHVSSGHNKSDVMIKPIETFVTQHYIWEDMKQNAAEYEKRWADIRRRYKKIRIYKNLVFSLGEMIARYFAMCEENNEIDTLYVVLPVFPMPYPKIANAFAMEYIGICGIADTMFWLYIIEKHHSDIDISDIDKYIYYRGKIYFHNANSVKPHFSEEQIALGNRQMQEMGIVAPYVCMSARSNQYFKQYIPDYIEDELSHRNAKFENYAKTIDYFKTQNILTVKMGRFEAKLDAVPNCIDYAGLYSNDFMDLYIFSKCEFAILGCNGITSIPQLFAKPILIVNAVYISFGFGGTMYSEYDMFIPKKHYDRNKKRYMTFMEIFEFEKNIEILASDYASCGIELHDNSPDEILDAAKEMMSRINGSWIDSKEDIENYTRWSDILKEMHSYQVNNPKNLFYGGSVPHRPAATFLRKNKFMLE